MDATNLPDPTGWLLGYARISTDDQRLDLQTDALVKYGVKPNNLFTDTASGAQADRPGFTLMWKALRAGDTLVVWKLDRLGRDLSQLVQTLELLKKREANLVVLTESIDTSTPMGRFLFGIMASMAQLERDLIVERTKAGLLAARERGRVGGRRVTIKPQQYEKAIRLMKPESEGGEDMSMKQAAKRARMSATSLSNHLKQLTEEESRAHG